MKKVTVKDILRKKKRGSFSMVTCYDYSFAKIVDASDIDIVLVGDSLANVVLGLSETKNVSVSEMISHTRAGSQGINRALIVADMPYKSYQINPKKVVHYAEKFIQAGADAVKVEWFANCPAVIKKIRSAGIEVMGHIGLTPQTAKALGGYKVQGKDASSALNLLRQAQQLKKLGVFSLVIECVPYQLAKLITRNSALPTIGIGAGPECTGQVLVLYDLLGLYKNIKPKFVKCYVDLSKQAQTALEQFVFETKQGLFPGKDNLFSMRREELLKIRKKINAKTQA